MEARVVQQLLEMDILTGIQIFDEAVCIYYPTNIPEYCMNLIIIPGMNEQYNRLGSLTLVWQTVQEKEN